MKDSFKELGYAELLTKREELKKKYLDLRFDMVVHHWTIRWRSATCGGRSPG